MEITTHYTGAANLQALVAAERYNRYLVDEILACGRDANSMLDFGAGIGTFCSALRRKGVDVACVEPDRGLGDRLEKEGFTVHHDIGEIGRASVSFLYSLNVLEHIRDDDATIDLLFDRLMPGGLLFLYVPAFPSLFTSMDRNVGHFRRYRKDSLSRLLKNAGFTIRSARYVDCLGFPASLIYKILGDSSGELSPASVRLYDTILFPVSRMLDFITGGMIGKNLLIVARKPRRDAGFRLDK